VGVGRGGRGQEGMQEGRELICL